MPLLGLVGVMESVRVVELGMVRVGVMVELVRGVAAPRVAMRCGTCQRAL
jgi:hypothetical protein